MVIDGVSRKLVEDAGCGVYVEPENPETFAKIVVEYADKPLKELHRMGDLGYKFAKQNFDRYVLAKKYIKKLATLNQ